MTIRMTPQELQQYRQARPPLTLRPFVSVMHDQLGTAEQDLIQVLADKEIPVGDLDVLAEFRAYLEQRIEQVLEDAIEDIEDENSPAARRFVEKFARQMRKVDEG